MEISCSLEFSWRRLWPVNMILTCFIDWTLSFTEAHAKAWSSLGRVFLALLKVGTCRLDKSDATNFDQALLLSKERDLGWFMTSKEDYIILWMSRLTRKVLELVGAINCDNLFFFQVSDQHTELLAGTFVGNLTFPITGKFYFAEETISALDDEMLMLVLESSGIELLNYWKRIKWLIRDAIANALMSLSRLFSWEVTEWDSLLKNLSKEICLRK